MSDQSQQWQSVDEWMDSTQFEALVKNEFPEDASEWLDPVSRRRFLTLMGASVALAGAVGCNPSVRPAYRRPVVPYVKQPEQQLPGIPLFFATAYAGQSGYGNGVIVKQQEGRPIKVEGNPNHPASLGGTNLISQATVLSLYDPDRSRNISKRGVEATFESFLEETRGALVNQRANQGERLRFLTEPTTSPTLIALMDEVQKRFPKMKWVQYEPVNRDAARRASVAAFGKPVNAVYSLNKAKVVLSLDCDFLSAAGVGHVRYARDFVAGRKPREVKQSIERGEGVAVENLNRLYVVESMVTPTGGSADHRLALPPSQVEDFARALAIRLGVTGITAPALSATAAAWVNPLAEDLLAHKGAVAILAGDTQPAAVHLIAHALNEKLGAFGQTVMLIDPVEPRPADGLAEFVALTKEVAEQKVDLLFVFGCNPVYDAPTDLDFGGKLAAMTGTKVHLGEHYDETAADGLCTWHVNAAHYLETWGDVRAYDGTASVQQPLIAPMHNGKTPAEILSLLLELGTSDALDMVRNTWKKFHTDTVKTGDFDAWWDQCVRDGVVPKTAFAPVAATAVKLDALNDKSFATPSPKGGIEIQFRPDLTLWDGRLANNGWLQELPKPVTNTAWDNAAMMSPALAEKLKVGTGFDMSGGEHGHTVADVVNITLDGRKLRVPVFILPGHADNAITLHLGYGRKRAGKVGDLRGFNSYLLRSTVAMSSLGGAEVVPTGDSRYPIACTQGQYLMESRRPARMATAAQFTKDPEFAQIPPSSAAEYKELRQLTPGTVENLAFLGQKHPYDPLAGHATDDHAHGGHGDDKGAGQPEHGGEHKGHDSRVIPLSLYPKYPTQVNGQEAVKAYRRWGLVVDLSACVGCNTCSIACVAENNTPVVGKDQVLRGRAMHWMRIDRYFSIPNGDINGDEFGASDKSPTERLEASKRSSDIKVHFQPLLCQQCEKAPCEVVCPVGATVHSADGLNDMVYNRCVGTRYCSNNCPYKVRRFNFLQYTDYSYGSLSLVNNPEVTVRTRGVMEKCTYCVARIRNAEMETEREFDKRKAAGKVDKFGRPKIMDGEIVTACQAACPTAAITFGDINDDDSAVLRAKAERHNYGLLAEQNTSPRTSYLAAIRNVNPAMPKGV